MERLREEVARVLPEAIEMRRHLHSHPELSGQEFQTRDYICEKLTEWSIPYRLCTRNTGVIADIGQGMPCIALRVDTDALPIAEQTGLPFSSEVPGVMHACGHDVHTAVLLGAANVLKGREETLNGTVRLLFQPAEETTGGADDMIREGCLENPEVSAVLGFHVDPAKAPGCAAFFQGTMNAAATDFTLTVQGKGCHGAHPEQGVDAIVVAAQLITALQKQTYNCNMMTFLSTERVLVTADESMAWTLDGERQEGVSQVEIRCAHKAIRIMRRRAEA